MAIEKAAYYRDSAGHLFDRPDDDPQFTALAAQIAGKADASAIPQPSDTMPMAEKTGAAPGTIDGRYARADHQHPRLTSTTYATLAADGSAAVTFTRAFTNKPGLNLSETDATAATQPLVLRGLAWTQDANGLYTGVTIQGRRAQNLPAITPLSGLLTLVSGVVTAVNAVFSSLTGYSVFGGSAAGASVSVIAVARSDVAAT